MAEEKLNIGLFGVGGKLILKDGYLGFSHPYGKAFRVRIADVDTVTIDVVGLGNSEFKVVGKGTVLASVKMPTPWANKCQEWVLSKI